MLVTASILDFGYANVQKMDVRPMSHPNYFLKENTGTNRNYM